MEEFKRREKEMSVICDLIFSPSDYSLNFSFIFNSLSFCHFEPVKSSYSFYVMLFPFKIVNIAQRRRKSQKPAASWVSWWHPHCCVESTDPPSSEGRKWEAGGWLMLPDYSKLSTEREKKKRFNMALNFPLKLFFRFGGHNSNCVTWVYCAAIA